MSYMFDSASSFNQPLGNWDVSDVTDMSYMFYNATSFDQDIGDWDVSQVRYMWSMFGLTKLSTPYYNDLLLGWSQLSLRDGIRFDAGSSRYSSIASNARQSIINRFNWIIIDGGLGIDPISITTPTIYSSWKTGTFQPINWTTVAGISNLRLELYNEESLILEIVSITPNDGELYWLVPSNLTVSTNFRIKIIDASDPSIYAYSGYFEIWSERKIPGYNLFVLLGLIGLISIVIVKKQRSG